MKLQILLWGRWCDAIEVNTEADLAQRLPDNRELRAYVHLLRLEKDKGGLVGDQLLFTEMYPQDEDLLRWRTLFQVLLEQNVIKVPLAVPILGGLWRSRNTLVKISTVPEWPSESEIPQRWHVWATLHFAGPVSPTFYRWLLQVMYGYDNSPCFLRGSYEVTLKYSSFTALWYALDRVLAHRAQGL